MVKIHLPSSVGYKAQRAVVTQNICPRGSDLTKEDMDDNSLDLLMEQKTLERLHEHEWITRQEDR